MAYNPVKVEDVVSNKTKAEKQYKNPSNFGKLSDVYQARIRKCDKEGALIDSDEQVVAVASEGEVHLESQYSTPFENSNPEQRLPTLIGMLQSGDWTNTASSVLGGVFGTELSADKQEAMNIFEGRSNLTKTNSTQIFVSSAPFSMNMTLYFEAWENAKFEVENQIRLLMRWTLPEKLENGSLIASVAENKNLQSLFPSIIPPYLALYHGGKKYAPMILNSLSAPIAVPMDSEGNRMALQVQASFLSRTAWDAENINQIYG
ncbi:hypothetical protein [Acinetobacter sp. ANC 3813]|uniref:hypothetical protein n=1 Tax=Acinetobacter sp. ANC 3813 TaxID=1977873 RepID=UPI000A34E6C0|nr:hypothetical protein [Acinetobacter sp. ANC 3813]OTG87866.1 hypothetical protein B9T34_16145 [Acinetobacter sp. ANC 3813]